MIKIESYIKCLKRETVDRAQLIDALEVATSYYDEQNGEVKTVAQVKKKKNQCTIYLYILTDK